MYSTIADASIPSVPDRGGYNKELRCYFIKPDVPADYKSL